MRKKVHLLTIIILIGTVCLAQDKDISVTITLEKEEIFVYEPLLIKITITNKSSKMAEYNIPINDKWGTILFELQKPNGKEFHQFSTPYSGMKGAEHPIYKLDVGKTLRDYEL